jgi:endonuclease/exonuclease/phosphatase family metal-dependent hydrolase
MTEASLETLRVMTYNVRACLGVDGRRRIDRIAAVINHFSPDVVALQELDADNPRSGRIHQAARIAELTKRQFHFTAARSDVRGRFGNATLSRLPFDLISEGRLPVRFGEDRTAHCLRIRTRHGFIDFINTHLSIHYLERLLQTKALFSEEPKEPTHSAMFPPLGGSTKQVILCGDLNAGRWSPVYRWLVRRLHDVQRGSRRADATWPSALPLLRLDHIWLGRNLSARVAFVPKTYLTRRASDHLPVIADVSLITRPSQPPVVPGTLGNA